MSSCIIFSILSWPVHVCRGNIALRFCTQTLNQSKRYVEFAACNAENAIISAINAGEGTLEVDVCTITHRVVLDSLIMFDFASSDETEIEVGMEREYRDQLFNRARLASATNAQCGIGSSTRSPSCGWVRITLLSRCSLLSILRISSNIQ